MHINRQELIGSANRRARRARRTTGRIVVSALGFGVAYYFDTENGDQRRKRLFEAITRTAQGIDSALATDEAGSPPRVFTPVLHAFESERAAAGTPPTSRIRGSVAAAR
jgi:hypothetical protein